MVAIGRGCGCTPNTGQNHQFFGFLVVLTATEAGILFQFEVIRCWGWLLVAVDFDRLILTLWTSE